MKLPIEIDFGVAQNVTNIPMQVASNTTEIPMNTASHIIIGKTNIYYDTTENWNSQRSLVAKYSCIYIYKDKGHIEVDGEIKEVPAIKIGDGTSFLIDMPFLGDDMAADLYSHIRDFGIHVTGDEKRFWNNKSSAFVNPDSTDTLVLSNNQYMINGEIYYGW